MKAGWVGQLIEKYRSFSHGLKLRRQRAFHRRYLMEMDDRLLKDIGVCRADINRLYLRKKIAPAHERGETDSVKNNQLNRQASNCLSSESFSACSGHSRRFL